jgi:serine protease SohB
MADILMQYGLFLAKVATFVVALWLLAMAFSSAARPGRRGGPLSVSSLNDKYREMALAMKRGVLSKDAFKKAAKAEKAQRKARGKGDAEGGRKRIFVVDFHGDIKATAVASLREELSAILSLARSEDEVLVRLENAGGLVHEHGLAASQLKRVRDRKIPLTIAVDKVAASGGYLMACVGNRILAAPFAVLGSIGVLAQLPNFHRLLDKHGIEFEQIKAGEFKRTLTLFGENTDKERAKMQQSLEELHSQFKEFVAANRPAVDIARVATGEYWHAAPARELGLVDELTTSDDYLLDASSKADIYHVSYSAKRSLPERVIGSFQTALGDLLSGVWHRLTAS